ncbi:DUF3800 domain-containing protein [Corynebacterium mastitidis]|uniref:DUF3800 domain-containing protein n=2 Tax=Corynebacterium mastitidis TaxID=161890 RepID=A0ABU8NUU8_9CORY
MNIIQNSGARVYLEGVDVNRLHARYRYPDSPHEIVLWRILECVNDHCARQDEKCRVIADMIPQKNNVNAAIRGRAMSGMLGCGYRDLSCVEGDINFVDSRASWGVQAADMSVYVLRRHREETSASKAAWRATARLVAALGPALVHQRTWLP